MRTEHWHFVRLEAVDTSDGGVGFVCQVSAEEFPTAREAAEVLVVMAFEDFPFLGDEAFERLVVAHAENPGLSSFPERGRHVRLTVLPCDYGAGESHSQCTKEWFEAVLGEPGSVQHDDDGTR